MFDYDVSQSSSLTLITFLFFLFVAAIVLAFCQQIEKEEGKRRGL